MQILVFFSVEDRQSDQSYRAHYGKDEGNDCELLLPGGGISDEPALIAKSEFC